MHFFRFSMIATLLAIAHSLPLNPQPSTRDVHGDGDIIIKRVPCEFPPAAPPSGPLTNKGHVQKRDPRIIDSTLPSPDAPPEPLRPRSGGGAGGCARCDPGPGLEARAAIKETKQGQFKGSVKRSPDGSHEQKRSQGLAAGRRQH
jgi:hypothetical protein